MQNKIERVGIHILAFLVARCCLFGMYPFIVPFFMGAYLQERSSTSLFMALMIGILSTLDGKAMIKYAMVLLFILVMLGKTDREKIFEDNYQIALASGVCLWAISMPYQYIITKNDSSLLYTFLDGIIAVCFVLIFEKGFLALRVGTDRMFAQNERFIGIFSLLLVALFGCPVITAPINLLFVICGYFLLYNIFRFESGIGIAMGSVAGFVLAIRMENISYLAVMILISSIMILLKETGKIGILLSYLAGILLIGFFYEKSLLSGEILKSSLISVFAFWMTPKKWLKQMAEGKKEITKYSQDILLQEATKNRIHNFGQAFLSMEKMMEIHETKRNELLEEGYGDFYINGNELSLLNAVESQSNRLSDIRRNFIRQIGKIGENIISFQGALSEQSVKIERFEGRLMDRLSKLGVFVTKAVPLNDYQGKMEVYVSCYMVSDGVVTGEEVARKISELLRRTMVCVNRGKDFIGKEESNFYFVEEGRYMLTTGLVRKNRDGESLCGDNFSITKLDTQKAVLMISDGMGSGEKAYIKSEQIMNLLEQLLQAGFCRELAIDLLNSFISFIEDGTGSSSLDLTMIDFYTGNADFIKLGASTTFIKRKDKVECIRSTSLPVGILEQVEFDTCARKLYHGDIIVMISDGIMDGVIFENKETYLADFIARIDTNNVQQIAEMIMQDVEMMQRGKLRDDSTVLVVGVWNR